ncbi:MAG: hypothetical protein ACTHWD_00210 [Lactobacillus delbrueckii]
MTATKKEIMKNAWRIAREGQKAFGGKVREYFAQALKMAWAQAKSTIDIEALEKKGFRRWTKGDMDRLYFNIEKSGHMEVDHYKTGNISYAAIDGEEVSHRFAGQILSVKCFIDLKNDNRLVIQYGGLEAREVVENIVKKVLA